jgi:hypothetical protein
MRWRMTMHGNAHHPGRTALSMWFGASGGIVFSFVLLLYGVLEGRRIYDFAGAALFIISCLWFIASIVSSRLNKGTDASQP